MTGSDPNQIQTSDQTKLTRGLKSRHVELIALGGAIGVGLFLGSAKAIQNAGPGLTRVALYVAPIWFGLLGVAYVRMKRRHLNV